MPAKKKPPVKNKAHVLIVEDSAIQATVLDRILKAAGYRTDLAKDGLEALAFLAEKRPDIVLSDVQMPHMDGIELCSRIRQEEALQGLPFILLTALSDTEDIIKGLSVGADDYISKPYEAERLLKKIEGELHPEKSLVKEGENGSILVKFDRKEQRIDASPVQIVKLLISTYENIISQNKLLIDSQVELKSLNSQLEEQVVKIKSGAAELRASDARFRSIVQLVPDLVYRIDEQGRFIFLNDAVETLGYEPDELIGKHFSVLIDERDVQAISRDKVLAATGAKATGDKDAPGLFDERRTGERGTKGLEVRLRVKGGKKERRGEVYTIIGEISSSGFYSEEDDGSIVFNGTVGAIRDVTERRVLEDQLEAMNEELEKKVAQRTLALNTINKDLESAMENLQTSQERIIQSEKLAAIGTLVAGVAHDLNNPLMGGLNYIKYVSEHIDSDKLKTYLEKAEREVMRASSIVHNMLTFSRKSGEEIESVNITDVVAASLELMAADFRHKEINVVVDLPSNLPKVQAKFDGLQQVFINLMTNARDAMEDLPKREIHISAKPIDEMLCVIVHDTGKGISKADLRRIFDPFYTTKAVGKGTGLGLSVSSNIISGFGGEMRCKSEKNKGASIIIKLQISKKRQGKSKSEEGDIEAVHAKAERAQGKRDKPKEG